MHHQIRDLHADKSLQRITGKDICFAARPATLKLQPRSRYSQYKFAAMVTGALVAAAVLGACFWTVAPEPLASLAIRSKPGSPSIPVQGQHPGSNPSAMLQTAAKTGVDSGNDLRQLDGLNGAELSAAFDALFKRAQAGDSILSDALARRLHECSSSQRLVQQTEASSVQIAGISDWAQSLDESWRQRCIGLQLVQLDKAAALGALAVSQGHPQALFDQAASTLSALEVAASQAVDSGQPANRTPLQIESALASVRVLDSLAQTGDFKAINMLAGLYAKGSVVDADAEKFLVYQLVSGHDWAQPALLMGQSPLLADLDAEVKQKVLKQAVPLFSSCCANKEKRQ